MIDVESDEEAPPPLTKKQEHLFTVYSDTAKVHAKQEQRQQCIEYTTMALAIKPEDEEMLLLRSKTYEKQEKLEEALQDADKVLSFNPNSHRALLQKADVLFAAGDFEYAMVQYHRGMMIRPDQSQFRLGVQKSKNAIEESNEQAEIDNSPEEEVFTSAIIPSNLDMKTCRDLTAHLLKESSAEGQNQITSRSYNAVSDTQPTGRELTEQQTLALQSTLPLRESLVSPRRTRRQVDDKRSMNTAVSTRASTAYPSSQQQSTINGDATSSATVRRAASTGVSKKRLLGHLSEDEEYLRQLEQDPVMAPLSSTLTSKRITKNKGETPYFPRKVEPPPRKVKHVEPTDDQQQADPSAAAQQAGAEAEESDDESESIVARPQRVTAEHKKVSEPPPPQPLGSIISNGLDFLSSRTEFWRQKIPPSDAPNSARNGATVRRDATLRAQTARSSHSPHPANSPSSRPGSTSRSQTHHSRSRSRGRASSTSRSGSAARNKT